ncbi:hypothetical protein EVAR_50599_1 [Eumeta japonica]|uniref:Uncharacterized protein n=1 Tax=Eumeta variegata TaxID=151549 RepID=A0A4C1YA81_EUMVA|nr:hypothetical protein EVAR_50599_1 [Eumeta japonica]
MQTLPAGLRDTPITAQLWVAARDGPAVAAGTPSSERATNRTSLFHFNATSFYLMTKHRDVIRVRFVFGRRVGEGDNIERESKNMEREGEGERQRERSKAEIGSRSGSVMQ